ncbi:hypothetical protein BKA56DRAFT_635573 [Ilyonectria sp. MPI-CAGE-AT-0026]|nr:hypothetical protein BKA56DRAFT_635573 [Ilyonectria sp. MPI-CAGE-AT-0026]
MDFILDWLNPILLDDTYELLHDCPSSALWLASHGWSESVCRALSNPDFWERRSIYRQGLSAFFITWLSSSFFFILFGTLCYHLNFDESSKQHPKFHKHQIRCEIKDSLTTLFLSNILTVPIFVAQIRGHSKLYEFGKGHTSWWYEVAQFPFFVLFSDTCMYWQHRLFHVPFLFNLTHKKHHRYTIPTPFSAYAFDPFEAWFMSLPIYAYSFIWPMSRLAQLAMFSYTNIWTFLLHDDRSQFHTVHHKNVKLNFGQYLPLWDYLAGTYADPDKYFFARNLKV